MLVLRRYFSRNVVQPKNSINIIKSRTFKNFGHKREPIPVVTTLWHGFLTFTFIGLAVKWDVIAKLIFGDEDFDQELQDSLRSNNQNKS